MKDTEHHCPYLNQSDPRCSHSLSIERLTAAFDYCFAHFRACSVYNERRAERRQRVQARPPMPGIPTPSVANHARPTFVQVSIARHIPQSIGHIEAVPALSGVGEGLGG